jgi:hypothetical protein
MTSQALRIHGHHLILGHEEIKAMGETFGTSLQSFSIWGRCKWRYSSEQEVKAALQAALPGLQAIELCYSSYLLEGA